MLDKAMALLRLAADGPIGFKELVERSGLSRATTHRLAQGLVAVGLLRRNDDGAYTLGLSLIGLGKAAADNYPLSNFARPILERLRDATGESVQLYVRDGDERLCIVAVDSAHELRTIVPVGARLPMSQGSAGRILEGECERHGWLASVAERAPGVASVSAPVWDGTSVLAAVSVSGPIERVTKRPGQLFGDQVVAVAREIEAGFAHGL